jgi:hypothetical protein
MNFLRRRAAEGARKKVTHGRENDNDPLSGMQRERLRRLSGLPRAGKAAQQQRSAAALSELPREGDDRLSRLPGSEAGKQGELEGKGRRLADRGGTMEDGNDEDAPGLKALGAITIEVAAGTHNGALTVATRVKHRLMLSDEMRLQLVMKLPRVLDELIRELSVGLPVPRPGR